MKPPWTTPATRRLFTKKSRNSPISGMNGIAAGMPPVPGVKAFIDSVRSLGPHAHVAYITNRNAPLEDATRANLKAAGLWQEGDVLLCQQSHEDTKEIRRSELSSGTGRCAGRGEKQIIALIGDQIGDVEAYPERDEATGHPSWNEQLRSYYLDLEKWGTHYFILPNPIRLLGKGISTLKSVYCSTKRQTCQTMFGCGLKQANNRCHIPIHQN